MAEIYLRGRIYWARGQDSQGKWWRQSTKQQDPRTAKAVAAKLEQELFLDANLARNETTLITALETLESHARRFKRAEATLEIMATKGRHLVRILGKSTTCVALTATETMRYVEKRLDEGASAHTVLHELKILVQALRRASKLGLYVPKVEPGHLMPDELRGAYVPRERWLSENEYRLLLDEFDPDRPKAGAEDRRDYIIIMCQTGVRLSELHGIEAQHCDFSEQLLHLQGTKTAGARRTIPLSPVAAEVLEHRAARTPHGPLFPAWTKVQRDLDLACLRIEAKLNPTWKRPTGRPPRAGRQIGDKPLQAKRTAKGLPPPKKDRVRPPIRFDPVSPNDLRRTFASWLAQNGVPLFHAAKLMGHTSTKMLERVYAQLAPENARAAIAMLPASVTAKPTSTPRKGHLKRVQ